MVSMIIQGVTVTAIMTSTDIKIATENWVRPPALSLMYDCMKIPGIDPRIVSTAMTTMYCISIRLKMIMLMVAARAVNMVKYMPVDDATA